MGDLALLECQECPESHRCKLAKLSHLHHVNRVRLDPQDFRDHLDHQAILVQQENPEPPGMQEILEDKENVAHLDLQDHQVLMDHREIQAFRLKAHRWFQAIPANLVIQAHKDPQVHQVHQAWMVHQDPQDHPDPEAETANLALMDHQDRSDHLANLDDPANQASAQHIVQMMAVCFSLIIRVPSSRNAKAEKKTFFR